MQAATIDMDALNKWENKGKKKSSYSLLNKLRSFKNYFKLILISIISLCGILALIGGVGLVKNQDKIYHGNFKTYTVTYNWNSLNSIAHTDNREVLYNVGMVNFGNNMIYTKNLNGDILSTQIINPQSNTVDTNLNNFVIQFKIYQNQMIEKADLEIKKYNDDLRKFSYVDLSTLIQAKHDEQNIYRDSIAAIEDTLQWSYSSTNLFISSGVIFAIGSLFIFGIFWKPKRMNNIKT